MDDWDVEPPKITWRNFLQEWRFRVAMRGFDDGTCWALNGHLDYPKFFKPPRIIFRKAYIEEFWEGASK